MLPLWRSINSINLMLPKEERKAMLLRLFNDESELIDNSKDRNQPKAEPDTAKTNGHDFSQEVVGNGDHDEPSKEEAIEDSPDPVEIIVDAAEQAETATKTEE